MHGYIVFDVRHYYLWKVIVFDVRPSVRSTRSAQYCCSRPGKAVHGDDLSVTCKSLELNRRRRKLTPDEKFSRKLENAIAVTAFDGGRQRATQSKRQVQLTKRQRGPLVRFVRFHGSLQQQSNKHSWRQENRMEKQGFLKLATSSAVATWDLFRKNLHPVLRPVGSCLSPIEQDDCGVRILF